ncbi:MAG: XkdX family protein [Lachnospiraceae bacterium]|nr:XkdX family protein [Lachnospiraceae bacterium]
MKEKIIKWYKLGLWTKEMVQNAVLKNILTQEEAEEIINE